MQQILIKVEEIHWRKINTRMQIFKHANLNTRVNSELALQQHLTMLCYSIATDVVHIVINHVVQNCTEVTINRVGRGMTQRTFWFPESSVNMCFIVYHFNFKEETKKQWTRQKTLLCKITNDFITIIYCRRFAVLELKISGSTALTQNNSASSPQSDLLWRPYVTSCGDQLFRDIFQRY